MLFDTHIVDCFGGLALFLDGRVSCPLPDCDRAHVPVLVPEVDEALRACQLLEPAMHDTYGSAS